VAQRSDVCASVVGGYSDARSDCFLIKNDSFNYSNY